MPDFSVQIGLSGAPNERAGLLQRLDGVLISYDSTATSSGTLRNGKREATERNEQYLKNGNAEAFQNVRCTKHVLIPGIGRAILRWNTKPDPTGEDPFIDGKGKTGQCKGVENAVNKK